MNLSLKTTGTAPEVRIALQNEFKRGASQNPKEALALTGLRDYVASQVGTGDGTDGVQYTVIAEITLSVIALDPAAQAAQATQSGSIASTLETAAASPRATTAPSLVTGAPSLVPAAPKL